MANFIIVMGQILWQVDRTQNDEYILTDKNSKLYASTKDVLSSMCEEHALFTIGNMVHASMEDVLETNYFNGILMNKVINDANSWFISKHRKYIVFRFESTRNGFSINTQVHDATMDWVAFHKHYNVTRDQRFVITDKCKKVYFGGMPWIKD